MMEPNRESIFNFGIDEDSRASMLETAKWTKFLAIVGFMFLGLMLLIVLFAMLGMGAFGDMMDDMGDMAAGFVGLSFMFLVIGVICFFATFYLYKYATTIKPAIITANQGQFNDAQRYLKRFFKIIGIIATVILAIYAFYFVMLFFIWSSI